MAENPNHERIKSSYNWLSLQQCWRKHETMERSPKQEEQAGETAQSVRLLGPVTRSLARSARWNMYVYRRARHSEKLLSSCK
jgi:hypothetical protein